MKLVAALAALVLDACGGGGGNGGVKAPAPSSKRTPDKDHHCNDKARPHAYEYPDDDSAETSGCGVARVYRQITDEKTGQTFDDELWLICCPAGPTRT